MREIVYILAALNIFYRSAHWRSKGPDFYENHLLFERLYEGIDDEIDSLVELLIGLDDDDSFIYPKVYNDKTQLNTPSAGPTSRDNFEIALILEKKLLDKIQSIPSEAASAGLYNQIANIADRHTRNLYLIRQTLK